MGSDVAVPSSELLPVAVAVEVGGKSVFLVACCWLPPRKASFVTVMLFVSLSPLAHFPILPFSLNVIDT